MHSLFSDIFIPQPRLDFYACVQAKKRKDSPHGKDTIRTPEGSVSEIEGIEFKNKLAVNPGSKKVSLGPYYWNNLRFLFDQVSKNILDFKNFHSVWTLIS